MLLTGASCGLVGVGYEGRNIDEFIAGLVADGVELLADVRLTPLSRKRGFSKRALGEALANAGIEYRHFRALGNPKDNRPGFWGDKPELRTARAHYQQLLDADEAVRALDELDGVARNARVGLMCFESDEARCHRRVILERLQRLGQ